MTETENADTATNSDPTKKPKRFVNLADAMKEMGIVKPEDMRHLAKKYHAYHAVGSLERIDLTTIETNIERDFEEKASRNASPRPKIAHKGSKVGLILARLAQYDKRLTGKDLKIAKATKTLNDASNAYGRAKAKSDLAKLQKERANLVSGKQRDEVMLEQLLNATEPESDVK